MRLFVLASLLSLVGSACLAAPAKFRIDASWYCSYNHGPALKIRLFNIGGESQYIYEGFLPWVGVGQLKLRSLTSGIEIVNWVDFMGAGKKIELRSGGFLEGEIPLWSMIEPPNSKGSLKIEIQHRTVDVSEATQTIDLDQCPITGIRE